VIGQRIEVIADLDRVRAIYDGKSLADHQRTWAWHQTIRDPQQSMPQKPCGVTGSARCGLLQPSPRCRSAAWMTTTPRSASPAT
jgi:hypothetical protein